MDEKFVRQTVRQVSNQLAKEINDGSFIKEIREQYAFELFNAKDPTTLAFAFTKTFSEKLVTEVLVQLLCHTPAPSQPES